MTPLEGLRLAELAAGVGARFAGRLLAQLGAEVVRPRGPGPETVGEGELGRAYAAWLDQGKTEGTAEGAALAILDGDAAAPEGALAARLGWFAPEGPRAGWRGSEAVVAALAGHAHPFGAAEGPPVLPPGDPAQVLGGAVLCIAALAGLIGRAGGCGPAEVSVPAHEAALCLTETAAPAFALGGPESRRLGVNRHAPTYPATCWETAEGWLGVTALTPAQWRALCGLVGLEDWGAAPRFATSDLRLEHADEIDAVMAPRIRARTAADWAEAGQRLRVPLTPAPRPGELPDDPHWRGRGSFAPLPAPFDGVAGPRAPWRLAPGRPAHPRPRPTPRPGAPLAGLRVLDFSMGWSGPLCTRHLADLGAEVIKVESPAHPDWWRGWNGAEAGDPPPHEVRPGFCAMNRGKRGVLIDLAAPEGLARARALAAEADLVVENFAPGVMDKLGLGAEALQRLAPGIVTVSMGGFGATGPKAGWRGYGSTVEQASGLAWTHGAEGWAPCLRHVVYGDAVAGTFAAVAALACLLGRERHGGAAVDLAQMEALFQIAAPAILAEQVTGAPVPRRSEGRPGAAVLRAAVPDAWLAVEALAEADREALAAVVGAPGGAALADWAAARDAETSARALQSAGLAAAPVLPAHALATEPQLVAAGFWTEAERAFVGRHLLPGAPFRLDGARPPPRGVAPVMGEHDALYPASAAEAPPVTRTAP